MISHKCYSNPHVLMMRSKASKNSSRGFQASSEINFLLSARKSLSTSSQIFDVIFVPKNFGQLNTQMDGRADAGRRPDRGEHRQLAWADSVGHGGVSASAFPVGVLTFCKTTRTTVKIPSISSRPSPPSTPTFGIAGFMLRSLVLVTWSLISH